MPLPDEAPDSNTLFSIELINLAQSMKEVYFNEGQGSVFTNGKTRNQLRWTIVLMVLSTIFYFISRHIDQVAYVVIFTISGYFAVFSFIWFLLKARKYFQWKTAVNTMIRDARSFQKISLNVKSSGFAATYDEQVVIEKWENFNRVTIGPTYIYLAQKEANYFFPANSMKESEYEALTQIVRSKAGNENAATEKTTQS
jgi:hypothetical protein